MSEQKLRQIILASIRAGVYVLPWFFVPGIQNYFGENALAKSFAVIIFAAVPAVLLALYSYRYSVRPAYGRGPLSALLLWLAAGLLVLFFSIDGHSSLWGAYGRPVLPWAMVLAWAVWAWGLLSVFGNWGYKRRLLADGALALALATSAFFIFYSLLFLGLAPQAGFLAGWGKVFLGPLEDQAGFFALALIFSLGLSAASRQSIFARKWQSRLVYWSGWLALANLLSINFSLLWPALAAAILILLAGHFKQNDRIGLRRPVFMLAAVVLLLVLNSFFFTGIADNYRLARQLKPDAGASWQLAWSAWRNDPLTGLGQDNFAYAVSRYRPAAFNEHYLWHIRFAAPGSFWAGILAGGGLIGLAAWVFLWFSGLRSAARIAARDHLGRDVRQILMAIPVFFLILGLFYSISVVLLFYYFLAWALAMAWGYNGDKSFAVANKDHYAAGQAVLAAALVFVLLFTAKAIWAERMYLSAQGRDEAKVLRASRLEPGRYQYHLALSKLYKEQAQALPGNQEEEYVELINRSLDSARQAIRIAPYAVVPQEALAMLYRDTQAAVSGGELLAIEAFRAASELEPANPVLHLELGKLFYRRGEYEQAREALARSVRLKPDYYNADLYLAKAGIASGRNEEALAILDKWEPQRSDAELFYEQGRAYFNLQDPSRAEAKFRRALDIEPLYANAIYSLALTLEQQDRRNEAVFYLKKVEQLNPGNSSVKDKIRELGGN